MGIGGGGVVLAVPVVYAGKDEPPEVVAQLSVACDTMIFTHFLPSVVLLFLCFAKEKVTKRKAIFFQRLRRKKRALRCYRSSPITFMALVLTL